MHEKTFILYTIQYYLIQFSLCCKVRKFDIEEFYPSISKDLLLKAIDYAKRFVNINDDETRTIMHSRISLLYSGTDMWIKKDGDKDFDVTIGTFNGAGTCEVVGLYILHKLSEKYGKERIGQYRDDGLACVDNTSGSEREEIRKVFIKIFKNEFSMNETNLKVASLLDLTLNLSTHKNKLYNKPDTKPLYISVNSNHPSNIIKNLSGSISRRINKLPFDKTVFKSFNNAIVIM